MTDVLHRILDLARWAPSGDNTQPWRFEILDDRRFVIHGHDTREHCVYDLDGRPSQISLGALIETAAIAASGFGLALDATRRTATPETRPTFDVTLTRRPSMARDRLAKEIPRRSVQRRSLQTRDISVSERAELEAAIASDHEVVWLTDWQARVHCARLAWASAGLRLRLPEAYETHRSVIEWDAYFSDDRMPDLSLGIDLVTRRLMRWALQSAERVTFLNKYLGGTVAPRIQMDLIPALRCAGYLAILAKQAPADTEAYVSGGRAVQRLWLTATRLGLQHQPAMTQIIFARYARDGRQFTAVPELQRMAGKLAEGLNSLLGGRADRAIWLGRIGHGRHAVSRSGRLPLGQLIL